MVSRTARKKVRSLTRAVKGVVNILPHVESCIITLREQRVMLDEDLAKLYGIETKALVQAVKRNRERFPEDFMFQLNNQEVAILRSQTVTRAAQVADYKEKRRRATAPYAFTEQGVAMLSSVLNSPHAVALNIEIMRIFVRVRALALSHRDVAKRLTELEQKTHALSTKHDGFSRDTRLHLKQVFDVLRELMEPPSIPPKNPMGFIATKDNSTKNKRLAQPRIIRNKKHS